MAGSTINNVSDTAFWIAYHRALESKRKDALFHDPLAEHLAGQRGRELAKTMPMSRMVGWTVAIRTCIIDDYIQMAVEGGIDTILNLGAGLDARPYRMELPGSIQWIEADYPKLVAYKDIRLRGQTPKCRIERVKIDLADQAERAKLFASVNSRANKLLVLTEGVVPYLSVDEAASLADDLRGMDRAAYWIVDYLSAGTMKYRQRAGMAQAMQNAPFKFAPEDWVGFFQNHGWQVSTMRYLADEGERLGRPFPAPLGMKIALKLMAPFTPKKNRDAWRHFAGYALLQPQ